MKQQLHLHTPHDSKTLNVLRHSCSTHLCFTVRGWIAVCNRFIGEWYEKEGSHHAPTEEQIAEGSKNCFIVGGIYIAWTVFALG